ncbi:MAG: hypothetical protein HY909_23130 [Deltaproteobacteria bacterium]|nr:hypothetical protein [Deltaproteobacteria bacterium]
MHARASQLTLATLLALGLWTPVAGAETRALGFGSLSVDLSVGRGVTHARFSQGRGTSTLAAPLVLRGVGGFSLGAGMWVECALRALATEGGAVRTTALQVGFRVDASEVSTVSLGLRLGYTTLLDPGGFHGAYAGAGLNVHLGTSLTLYGEGYAELFPSPVSVGASANGGARDPLSLVAELGGLAGVRAHW